MFEDDSTGSFEKLEMRLKTPKRPLPSKSFAETKIPERFVTETIENDGQISTSEEKEGVVEEPNKPETDNVLVIYLLFLELYFFNLCLELFIMSTFFHKYF